MKKKTLSKWTNNIFWLELKRLKVNDKIFWSILNRIWVQFLTFYCTITFFFFFGLDLCCGLMVNDNISLESDFKFKGCIDFIFLGSNFGHIFRTQDFWAGPGPLSPFEEHLHFILRVLAPKLISRECKISAPKQTLKVKMASTSSIPPIRWNSCIISCSSFCFVAIIDRCLSDEGLMRPNRRRRSPFQSENPPITTAFAAKNVDLATRRPSWFSATNVIEDTTYSASDPSLCLCPKDLGSALPALWIRSPNVCSLYAECYLF